MGGGRNRAKMYMRRAVPKLFYHLKHPHYSASLGSESPRMQHAGVINHTSEKDFEKPITDLLMGF